MALKQSLVSLDRDDRPSPGAEGIDLTGDEELIDPVLPERWFALMHGERLLAGALIDPGWPYLASSLPAGPGDRFPDSSMMD